MQTFHPIILICSKAIFVYNHQGGVYQFTVYCLILDASCQVKTGRILRPVPYTISMLYVEWSLIKVGLTDIITTCRYYPLRICFSNWKYWYPFFDYVNIPDAIVDFQRPNRKCNRVLGKNFTNKTILNWSNA